MDGPGGTRGRRAAGPSFRGLELSLHLLGRVDAVRSEEVAEHDSRCVGVGEGVVRTDQFDVVALADLAEAVRHPSLGVEPARELQGAQRRGDGQVDPGIGGGLTEEGQIERRIVGDEDGPAQ
jgi:hypothetical protein